MKITIDGDEYDFDCLFLCGLHPRKGGTRVITQGKAADIIASLAVAIEEKPEVDNIIRMAQSFAKEE